MSTSKRHHKPDELDESGRPSKVAKLAPTINSSASMVATPSRSNDPVEITVSIQPFSEATGDGFSYQTNSPRATSETEEFSIRDSTGELPTASPSLSPRGSPCAVNESVASGDQETVARVGGASALPEPDAEIQSHDKISTPASIVESDADNLGDESPLDADDDEDYDYSYINEITKWSPLENIDAFATERNKKIATCKAKLIRRDEVANAFWEEMEEASEDTSELAFELFDRYGQLNREYYEHEVKRGTGSWGRELERDDILLFESLSVRRHKRRQKIGTKIVEAVLEEARSNSGFFVAFAKPGYLIRGMDVPEEDDEFERLEIATQFWRSLGFRRVGTSSWFAFTDDLDHPSRQLDISEDWNEPEGLTHDKSIPETILAAFGSLSAPETTGTECVRELQETLSVAVEDSSWLLADKDGNTMLHLAALGSKPEAVEYILSARPTLATTRNREGYTPLEALYSKMELMRTRRELEMRTAVLSDEFAGFEQLSLACLGVLTSTKISDLDDLSPEFVSEISSAADEQASSIPNSDAIRHTLRMKYGCTCGECVGGFLSRRMTFALLCQAKARARQLRSSLDTSGGWVTGGAELAHIPRLVRDELKTNRSMREVFANICDQIASCLNRRRIPNENNVLALQRFETSEGSTATTVAAVASMLFEYAMREDRCSGNGSHQRQFRDEIKDLPECRNDHEFGFVSGMCGYRRVSRFSYAD